MMKPFLRPTLEFAGLVALIWFSRHWALVGVGMPEAFS